ncbi:iron chelate uptake ABC transporter family permease subunit [Bacillaceae bacterium SIJ1]|uniref:iron chelate uptake ABC transporter family permease subunit n=1 Tax=Litoribacterium kuwaitense TaxID=1398745 RepID=UPI0013ECB6B8|nr:iron chelate uptake ABC transporter family permease subunit [Litoribacterium kuwaitense]NGP44596.1 iron chelate uptake ABC transporter family permease subunit [Litoribacterium kuwaitense]
MDSRLKLLLLFVVMAGAALLFLFYDAGSDWGYVLPRRGEKIWAMLLVGAGIALSTVLFQTITNNRILTPSIIGFDSLYMFLQTAFVFVLGQRVLSEVSEELNFLLSVLLMVGFALLLFLFLLRYNDSNVYLLLLLGMIVGTLFTSMTTFMEVLIDPNDFTIVQSRMFASFNSVDSGLLVLSTVLMGLIILYYSVSLAKYMDVISLGKAHAVNLGVNYNGVVRQVLIVVALLVSIATALVGPITFLGLLVANVTYQLMKTYKHRYVVPASMLLSMGTLLGGQFIVEQLFSFATPLAVIINLVGGIYFFYLLLKENRAWSK